LFSATKLFFSRKTWCRQQKVVFGNKTFLWQKHGVANKNLLLATKLFFGRSMVSPTKTCFWQQNFSLAEAWCRQQKLASGNKTFLWQKNLVSPTKTCFWQQKFSLAEAWCRQQKLVFGNKTFLWQKNLASPTKTCFWQQNFSLAEKPGALANKNLFSATRCFIFGQWSVNCDFNRWL